MTKTIKNIVMLLAFVAFAFMAFSFVFQSDTQSPFAFAAGTCGSCGDDPVTPPTGGGGSDDDDDDDSPTPPVCTSLKINKTVVRAGENYTVSWDASPSDATFKVNGDVVKAKDSLTQSFNGDFDYFRFVLYGENGPYKCSEEVRVEKEVPTCDIQARWENKEIQYVDNIGDFFNVKWTGTPSDANFTINGDSVANSGKVKLDFIGPNFERFTLRGDLDGATCQDVVEVRIKPTETPTPKCDFFTADETTIFKGDSINLSWGTTNATRVTLGGNDVALNASVADGITRSPSADKTFNLVVYGADGTTPDNSCKIPVKVVEKEMAMCEFLTATPETINEGEEVTLTWATKNGTRVVIDNGPNVVSANSDSANPLTVKPLADTVYKLTVFGDDDTTTDDDDECTAPVKVNPKTNPTEPDIKIVKDDNDNNDDTQTVDIEGTAVFSIVVTNNGDEDLKDVVVTDPVEPNCDHTIGNLAIGQSSTPYICESTNVTAAFTNTAFVTGKSVVDGDPVDDNDPTTVKVNPVTNVPVCNSFSIKESAVAPGANLTFNWNTTNVSVASINQGINSVSVDGVNQTYAAPTAIGTYEYILTFDGKTNSSCRDTVVVQTTTTNLTCSDIVLSASDTSVRRGSDVTLEWVSTGNVSSVSIDQGIGSVAVTGTEKVTVNSNTTYNFTINGLGDTQSCPITIKTTTGGGSSPSPKCELEISDDKIELGEEVTIKWDTSNATEVTLKDDKGKIIFTTDNYLSSDKKKYFDHEIDVKPTRNTTYTLLAERGSKDRECDVEVEIEGEELPLLQVRNQAPLVAGISLTQVPYTGFEAGPTMTILFYMLLIAWALYITYVLVIPKTRLAVATVDVVPKSNEDLMAHAESIRPDVFAALPTTSVAPAPAPTPAAIPSNLPVADVAPVMPIAAPVAAEPVITDVTTQIENLAHQQQALISSDAVRTIAGMTTEENRVETINKIVVDAKGAFPLEDGWVVINQSRLSQITAAPEVATAIDPQGAGSLAESIVTGNIVAAYDLIGARPMIALADAAADLDAVYRNRKGEVNQVSEMLTAATAGLTNDQVTEMIAALTGALDGTYTDEASAVKMAIMKAVKVAA